jgi:hypothetical protein
MDTSELEAHKIIVKELGNMEVIPYTRVLEFLKKYEQFDLQRLDNVVKELEDSLNKLNSEIKEL